MSTVSGLEIANNVEREWRDRLEAAVLAEREFVLSLLKGIDKDECESPDGWWETSKRAEFGAGILAAIKARDKHDY